ncbi:MAG: hypothetical protein J6I50_05375 [Clostridia bacterium]|nr:hypothetical protein [Clostridia bacterium]
MPKKKQNRSAKKAAPTANRTHSAKQGLWRYAVLCVLFLTVISLYIVRFMTIQHADMDGSTVTYNGEKITVTQRTVTVKARRGSILDRNGTPLVQDIMRYQMVLDAVSFPKEDASANETLFTLLTLFDHAGIDMRTSTLPVTDGYADGRYLFFLKPETLSSSDRTRYENYLVTLGMDTTVSLTAEQLLDAMFVRYHLYEETETDEMNGSSHGASTSKNAVSSSSEPETETSSKHLLYDMHTAYRIAAIRYDLEVLQFDAVNPYVLLKDTDLSLITPIKEQNISGVTFHVQTEREYCYPGYASHILGRTGKIQAESVEYYTAQGYPLDAVVGLDGIEGAMEEVLRGTDGKMQLEMSADGSILKQTVIEEAIPGKDVYLTLDIELQIKAEEALSENIAYIAENARATGEAQSGEDADAGALIVVDPNNGAILASASHPTFDLAAYDYTALSQDEKLPLLNRALQGTYAPGSVFKVGIAAAAMENGIITPETKIDTKGIYTYYDDYQPRCWLYTRTGLSHGSINVIEALCDSCNYFFFDVGRQLGANTMADFMTHLGLGQKTGVELPESAGILSSPAYTQSKGITWTGAATLQTAIGQAYNAYTPIQLAMYLSTIVNGGTRYQAHYVLGMKEAGATAAPLFDASGEVIEKISISEETHAALIEAMHEVAENGSATRVFRGYGIPVGAKTGTAEIGGDGSPNAVFAGFAPLNAPELLCVSVIENGASGTSAGLCVRDVFDAWFGGR